MSCAVSDKNAKRVWTKESISKMLSTRYKSYTGTGTNNPNYKGGGIDCVCQGCEKKFKIPQHNQKHQRHSGKYCSKECCYDTWRKNRMSVSQRNLNKLFSRNISRILKGYKEETADKWLEPLAYTRKMLKEHLVLK